MERSLFYPQVGDRGRQSERVLDHLARPTNIPSSRLRYNGEKGHRQLHDAARFAYFLQNTVGNLPRSYHSNFHNHFYLHTTNYFNI